MLHIQYLKYSIKYATIILYTVCTTAQAYPVDIYFQHKLIRSSSQNEQTNTIEEKFYDEQSIDHDNQSIGKFSQ